MAQETGDLYAAASGSASLGVEQVNGGLTTDIRPYAHVHMNSGVFHNPSRGSSGVIRYQNDAWSSINGLLVNNAPLDYFGFSFDGGLNWPLEIGGNVGLISGLGADMLTPFGGLRWIASGIIGLISIDGAVNIATFSGPGSGAITLGTLGHDNDIELDTVGDSSLIRLETNGLASHIDIRTFGAGSEAFLRTSDADLTIDCGGLTRALEIFSDNTMTIDSEGAMTIDCSDLLQMNVDELIIGSQIASVTITAATSILTSSADDTSILTGKQLSLSAFGGSGTLEYRFGPFESWHQENRGTNIFYPIPHSGHINQMIQASRQNIGAAGSGLQTNYAFHPLIIPTTARGDLTFIANTAKTTLSTFGTQAELNMSGLFTPPTLANLVTGDMYMMNNSVISGIVAAKTSAVSRAQALGIGTLAIQTGSGIINVSIGSGLAQFGNSVLQQITTALTTVNLTTTLESGDQNYGMGTGLNSGVITVFSPGLYKINYKITIDKTVGSNPQECTARLELNDSGSAAFGSVINTIHINNSTASSNTSSTVILLNMDAGDNVRMKVNSSLAGADNCNIIARGATMMIEKVGPKRGAAGS